MLAAPARVGSPSTNMRRSSLLAALVGVGFLTVAGIGACTSDGATSGQSATSGAQSESSSPQSEDVQSGGDQAVSEQKPEVDRDPKGPLPKMVLPTEKEGPVLKPIDESPPKIITVETLKEGDGDEIGPDDFIKVNYSGFLWDGEQFDSSYTSSGVGAPISFSLNQVITGWKWGLSETQVGDQVMLVIPPEYGYGAGGTGNIPGDSTLVFFVDILEAVEVNPDILKKAEPTSEKLPKGMEIEGEVGLAPTVTFEKNAPAPEKAETIILAEGTGSVITDDEAVEYYMTAGYWGSKERSYTWDDGISVVEPGSVLVGEKVGSRVLIVTPADDAGNPPTFVLVDVLATHPPR